MKTSLCIGIALALVVPAIAQVEVEDLTGAPKARPAGVQVEDLEATAQFSSGLKRGDVVELELTPENHAWYPRDRGNCRWLPASVVLEKVAEIVWRAGLKVGPNTTQLLAQNAARTALAGAAFVNQGSARLQRGSMNVPPILCRISTDGYGNPRFAGVAVAARGGQGALGLNTAHSEAGITLSFFDAHENPIGFVRGAHVHNSKNVSNGAVAVATSFLSRLLNVPDIGFAFAQSTSPQERAARFATEGAILNAGDLLAKIVPGA